MRQCDRRHLGIGTPTQAPSVRSLDQLPPHTIQAPGSIAPSHRSWVDSVESSGISNWMVAALDPWTSQVWTMGVWE